MNNDLIFGLLSETNLTFGCMGIVDMQTR